VTRGSAASGRWVDLSLPRGLCGRVGSRMDRRPPLAPLDLRKQQSRDTREVQRSQAAGTTRVTWPPSLALLAPPAQARICCSPGASPRTPWRPLGTARSPSWGVHGTVSRRRLASEFRCSPATHQTARGSALEGVQTQSTRCPFRRITAECLHRQRIDRWRTRWHRSTHLGPDCDAHGATQLGPDCDARGATQLEPEHEQPEPERQQPKRRPALRHESRIGQPCPSQCAIRSP